MGSTKTCISRERLAKKKGSINTCCAVICCSCHNPVMQGSRTESLRASMQVYMQESTIMAFFSACCNEEFDGRKKEAVIVRQTDVAICDAWSMHCDYVGSQMCHFTSKMQFFCCCLRRTIGNSLLSAPFCLRRAST